MPLVDTVMTVSHLRDAREEIEQQPKFKVGDYVEIISNEVNFTVKAVRWNHDYSRYEYLSEMMADSGWFLEAAIDRA